MLASRTTRLVCSTISQRAFATLSTSAASSPSASPTYYPTFDYRRLRLRSEWRVPQPEDGDYFITGDEGLGQNIEVNWAINRLKVIPIGDAYRNLHYRGLRMLTPSERDSTGRIVVSKKDASSHKTFVVLPQPAPVAEGQTAPKLTMPKSSTSISESQASQTLREVRLHLSSEVQTLFLHDGSVGETLSRSLADDPSTAVLLRNTILPVSLGTPASFNADVTSYLSYSLPNSTSLGTDANTSFSILNLASNTLIMGGRFTSSNVIASLAALANYQTVQNTEAAAVPLPQCHSAITSTGVSLVFGSSQPVICPQLFGAHNNTWSKVGLIRSFNGAIVTPPPSKYTFKSGDLLEKASTSDRLVANTGSSVSFTAPQPNRVVFVAHENFTGNGNLFSASTKQGANLFKNLVSETIPGIDADQLTLRFAELLETNKTSVFVVKGNANEIQLAIAAATSGNARATALDSKLFI